MLGDGNVFVQQLLSVAGEPIPTGSVSRVLALAAGAPSFGQCMENFPAGLRFASALSATSKGSAIPLVAWAFSTDGEVLAAEVPVDVVAASAPGSAASGGSRRRASSLENLPWAHYGPSGCRNGSSGAFNSAAAAAIAAATGSHASSARPASSRGSSRGPPPVRSFAAAGARRGYASGGGAAASARHASHRHLDKSPKSSSRLPPELRRPRSASPCGGGRSALGALSPRNSGPSASSGGVDRGADRGGDRSDRANGSGTGSPAASMPLMLVAGASPTLSRPSSPPPVTRQSIGDTSPSAPGHDAALHSKPLSRRDGSLGPSVACTLWKGVATVNDDGCHSARPAWDTSDNREGGIRRQDVQLPVAAIPITGVSTAPVLSSISVAAVHAHACQSHALALAAAATAAASVTPGALRRPAFSGAATPSAPGIIGRRHGTPAARGSGSSIAVSAAPALMATSAEHRPVDQVQGTATAPSLGIADEFQAGMPAGAVVAGESRSWLVTTAAGAPPPGAPPHRVRVPPPGGASVAPASCSGPGVPLISHCALAGSLQLGGTGGAPGSAPVPPPWANVAQGPSAHQQNSTATPSATASQATTPQAPPPMVTPPQTHRSGMGARSGAATPCSGGSALVAVRSPLTTAVHAAQPQPAIAQVVHTGRPPPTVSTQSPQLVVRNAPVRRL